MTQNKTIIQNIVQLQEKTIDTAKSHTEILQIMADTMDKIVDKLIILFRLVELLIFINILLIWKVFFFEPFNNFLSMFIFWWPSLSEAWQIFIVSIPILLIIHILGSLIVDKLIGKK